ncbi:uncharacterized protein CheA84a [Halyomorpha halys]|uniref:uncharacterized protein CheA84a n=1 Tax=Halyomorpha halys TaxID=286706 RepID=UPI0006D4F67E
MLQRCIFALLIMTTLMNIIFSREGQVSGRYDVAVLEIARCDDDGTDEITFSSTKLSRANRNTVNYQTNYTLKISLDDSISAVSDLHVWGNGGWRPGFFTLDSPHVCTATKQLNPKWFSQFIKNTGRDDCPIPPGTYEMYSPNISSPEFTIPAFPYGKYKAINQLFKDSVLVGCIVIVIEVTPKRNLPKKKQKH